MALNLKRLKQIDSRHSFVVFGYVRESSKELELSNIPMMIFYLCLGYFFEGDYFEKFIRNVEISENKTRMEHRGGDGEAIAICKQWIDCNVHQMVKWEIKMNNIPCLWGDGIIIRLSTNDVNTWKSPSYGFGDKKNTWTDGPHTNRNKGIAFYDNDIIIIILNTRDATIGIRKNNQQIHIIWDGIATGANIRYKLSISSFSVGTSVSLIDYSSRLLH